jgi:hypothetical protein
MSKYPLIGIRVTPEQHEILRNRAASAGMSLSKYAKQILLADPQQPAVKSFAMPKGEAEAVELQGPALYRPKTEFKASSRCTNERCQRLQQPLCDACFSCR